MQYKILVVDDEPTNIRLLERIFNRHYQVLSATSGKEAMELLRQHNVAVIISDQRMPEMSGIEFLKQAAELRPRVIRIIISGYSDVNVLTEAINSGIIYRFISKPWNNEDLLQTVSKAIDHYEVIKRQYELLQANDRLTTQLASIHRIMGRLIADLADLEENAASAMTVAEMLEEQNLLMLTPDTVSSIVPAFENEPEMSEAVS